MTENPLIDAPIRIKQVKCCIDFTKEKIKKIEEQTTKEFMALIVEQEFIISQAKDKVKELKKELKEITKTRLKENTTMLKMYQESLLDAETIYHNAKLKERGEFHET